jgi:hypothetical protein
LRLRGEQQKVKKGSAEGSPTIVSMRDYETN